MECKDCAYEPVCFIGLKIINRTFGCKQGRKKRENKFSKHNHTIDAQETGEKTVPW